MSVNVVRRRSLRDHLDRHLGEPAWVWHEGPMGGIEVDLVVYGPTAQRRWYVVATEGMSDGPMRGAREIGAPPYAELYLALSELDRNAPLTYWPLLLLRIVPRYAHAYSPMAPYLTTALADPPEPFAPDTGLCAAMVARPRLFPEEFSVVAVPDDEPTRIHAVVPLHLDELDLVRERGSGPLRELFEGAGVTELLDPRRPSVIAAG